MSPTPVTYTSPGTPASYSWEATDEEVAARYGLDPATIVRFDLNTSPVPPDLARRLLAAGRFVAPLSEYPPTDYRALVEAAAARYGVTPAEILVGAGADEILDIVAKTFLTSGGRAIVPTPTYSMYRVVTEQRGGTVVAVPRLGQAAGWAVDQAAVRMAMRAHGATVIWLCSPNNPTALAEPEGAIEELLAGIATDAAAAGRSAPVVVLDEAYAEFVGTTLLALRDAYPNLIVVRTASKAYALAGLRVGFAVARPELIARLNPFRPPGSISTVSITLVTEALRDESILADNLARVETERTRLTEALTEIGWEVGPSVTNFLLVDFATTERAAAVADGLLKRALVPRTFGEGHPLADHLRLTIRAADENDRLIAAATELARETTA
jgi:histidinol-phosphate aminotransferase